VKHILTILLFWAVILPTQLRAQIIRNAEFSGGFAYSTGNFGLGGFNAGGALWFTNRISLAFDFDRLGNNKQISLFALNGSGLFTTKTTLYNFMIGPRFFFHSTQIKVLRTIHPFAEVEVGASHISSSVNQPSVVSESASDNAGSWLIGGGADILASPHWAARVNVDYFRTHFVDAGQSRLRLEIGAAYTFGSRTVH
jgi:opacity protein-like surface antigen